MPVEVTEVTKATSGFVARGGFLLDLLVKSGAEIDTNTNHISNFRVCTSREERHKTKTWASAAEMGTRETRKGHLG